MVVVDGDSEAGTGGGVSHAAAEISSECLSIAADFASGDATGGTSSAAERGGSGATAAFSRLRHGAAASASGSHGGSAAFLRGDQVTLGAASTSAGDPSSSFTGFQRSSTNDLRRSLRRINSITRRKLSPGRGGAASSAGGAAPTPSSSSGGGFRKNSYCAGETSVAEEREEEEREEEADAAKVTDPLTGGGQE